MAIRFGRNKITILNRAKTLKNDKGLHFSGLAVWLGSGSHTVHILQYTIYPWLTPLYQLYKHVPPQKVWFLSRFGPKSGMGFEHYGLKSGMVFKGTTRAYKRICLFNSK